ncbi:MAG: hypothetical protein AB1698_01530 [Pseudomonadota bacterium]
MAGPQPLDRDKLFTINRATAAEAAHEALFPIQEKPPHAMVAGIAVLFAAVCNRTGVDPHDAHTFAMRLLKPEAFDKKTNDSLQSLRDFAGIHIKGDQDVSIS